MQDISQRTINVLFRLEETLNGQQKSHEQFHLLTVGCVGYLMTAEMQQMLESATAQHRRIKRLYCKLRSQVFLLLYIHLLKEKLLHTDALGKKCHAAELQVPLTKVIPRLVPISFSFLLCCYLFQIYLADLYPHSAQLKPLGFCRGRSLLLYNESDYQNLDM